LKDRIRKQLAPAAPIPAAPCPPAEAAGGYHNGYDNTGRTFEEVFGFATELTKTKRKMLMWLDRSGDYFYRVVESHTQGLFPNLQSPRLPNLQSPNPNFEMSKPPHLRYNYPFEA
jgi:hypothetical protein